MDKPKIIYKYAFNCEKCKKLVKRVKLERKAHEMELLHSGLCQFCDHAILVRTMTKEIIQPKKEA